MSDPPDVPGQGESHEVFDAWREEAKLRRAAEIEATERARRKIWLGGLWRLMVVEWCAVGMLLYSWHMTGGTGAWIVFWSSLGFGDGGFLVLLVITVRKVEQVKPW